MFVDFRLLLFQPIWIIYLLQSVCVCTHCVPYSRWVWQWKAKPDTMVNYNTVDFMAQLYFQLSDWIRSANRETVYTPRAAMIRTRVRCYCRTRKKILYDTAWRGNLWRQRMHEPVRRRRIRFPFIFIAFANCKMFVLFHVKFNCALYMVYNYTPSSTQLRNVICTVLHGDESHLE